jgi:mono/diheme cytochrome c family protein
MAASAAEGDSAAGREVAIKTCARCHVIGDYNPMGGIGSTPSFWIMARKPQTYTAKILTVTRRRPHRGMGLEVTPKELEQVRAYIATQKQD